MSERQLVQLDDRFPNVSRSTRWRIEREPDFPRAIVIRNRKYYDANELTAWEEARRRREREAATSNNNTA
jgi:predicted DNA-binding transcriptional regulator AlpA